MLVLCWHQDGSFLHCKSCSHGQQKQCEFWWCQNTVGVTVDTLSSLTWATHFHERRIMPQISLFPLMSRTDSTPYSLNAVWNQSKCLDCDCDTGPSITIAFNLIRNMWCQQCLTVLKCVTSRTCLLVCSVCDCVCVWEICSFVWVFLVGILENVVQESVVSNMRQGLWSPSLD